jgi:tetratricopeptide (TPR) repeat protein
MRPNRFCTAFIVAQGFLFSGLLFPGMVSIGHAADGQPPTALEATPSPAKTVDSLFASLKKERNAVKARSIANQIASEWNDSGSATINLLMQWAGEASDEKRNAAAFDFLDQVVLLDPDYVQAPYRRAMVHFADGDTRKAMADINLTLEKEPRYFPALASLANILEASGRDDLALKAWERYLALYPADKDVRKQAADLSEKLAGTRG